MIDVSSGVAGGASSGGSPGRGSGDGVRWPLALGAVLVAGLLVWMLTRSSDGPGQVEQTFDEEAERERATTTARPQTSTTQASSTTVLPFASAEGVERGRPLLGAPVGLTLFVGGVTTRAVDLDTGAVSEIALDGAPLLVIDEWLVVANTEGGSSVVNRLDRSARPRSLSTGGFVAAAFPDGPDHLWVPNVSETSGELQWTSVSLVDGTTRTLLEPTSLRGTAVGPEVGGTASGGVYLLNEDRSTYRRLADGNPLAVSADWVLVQLCTSPTSSSCRIYWIDRSTGREVDRFVPPGIESLWGISSSPSGAFVATESVEGVTLWDIGRGSEITTDLSGFKSGGVLGYSPDDRFVAFVGRASDEIVIYDSDSGLSHVITMPDRRIRPYGLAFGPTG